MKITTINLLKNNKINLFNFNTYKKEFHPLYNSGKQIYLYEILENKLIIIDTFPNIARAHEALGISRSTIWRYIKNNTVIYSNILAPKKKGSGFIAGKIKNSKYKGKLLISF